jgi:hypothetical protein
MWVAVWYVSNDKHLGRHREGNGAVKGKQRLGAILIFVPVVLSAVFFFSSYSASLDLGSVVMTLEQWNQIKDNPDAVRALFVK